MTHHFWNHVDPSLGPDVCWPYMGSRDKDGYGLAKDNRTVRAHRLALRLAGVEVPRGVMVLHSCDNPPCCNPAHLRLGNARTNAADMVSRGRAATGLRNAAYTHPERIRRGSDNGWSRLTEDQVAVIKRRIAWGDTNGDIARDYGVTNGTIWFIAKGRNWTHVQAAA